MCHELRKEQRAATRSNAEATRQYCLRAHHADVVAGQGSFHRREPEPTVLQSWCPWRGTPCGRENRGGCPPTSNSGSCPPAPTPSRRSPATSNAPSTLGHCQPDWSCSPSPAITSPPSPASSTPPAKRQDPAAALRAHRPSSGDGQPGRPCPERTAGIRRHHGRYVLSLTGGQPGWRAEPRRPARPVRPPQVRQAIQAVGGHAPPTGTACSLRGTRKRGRSLLACRTGGPGPRIPPVHGDRTQTATRPPSTGSTTPWVNPAPGEAR
jgi:hypothetical protein